MKIKFGKRSKGNLPQNETAHKELTDISTPKETDNMNNFQVFNNEEFGQVRVMLIENEPWFVGKDVAELLGYSNTRDAIAKRVDDDDKMDGVAICDSIGREQHPVLINESGLYSLVMSSKMKEAKKFKKWVTKEVIPTIRKDGGYVADYSKFVNTHFSNLTDDQKAFIRMSLENSRLQAEKIVELEGEVEEMQPKAGYYDEVLTSPDCYTATQIAKGFGMSAQMFNKILRNFDVQYEQRGQWLLMAAYDHLGYTKTETFVIRNADRKVVGTRDQTVWTQKGKEFIIEFLKKKGYEYCPEEEPKMP